MILLVDVGGTRTKLGRLCSQNFETVIQKTPSSLKELSRLVEEESPSRWALALPGRWDHQEEVWTAPFIWEKGSLSAEEIRGRFQKAPSYITNDLSAAAWGLTGSWACLLISTGAGVRILRDGKIVMEDHAPYLANFTEQRWQGRTLLEWLSWRGMQSWMPSGSWREVGKNPPKKILEAVRYFADSLEEETRLPVMLLGGGAQALRPHLPHYHYPEFEQPALRGLWRGLRGANLFTKNKM